ncbi:MAG: thiol-disulfide oxidoreductase DCC family protein [Pseudomonadota bacterium]
MILVFDAQCLLCNGSVQFILKHDHHARFRFASIQGAHGRALLEGAGLPPDNTPTLLLVDGERSWQYSGAVIRIGHALGWPWRMAWLAWLVPSPLRDAAYRLVARNRYRWFGRTETCMLPPPDAAARFLD